MTPLQEFLTYIYTYIIFTAPGDPIFWWFCLKLKTKKLLYKFIKNKRLIWIMDTFLSLDIVGEELLDKKWMSIGYRLLIHFFAFKCFKLTMLLWILYIIQIFTIFIVDFLHRYISSYQTKFKFQALPLPIQQRFYELQSPLIRYRLPKAYFNRVLIKSYNQLYIDNLILNSGPNLCYKLVEDYPIANHMLPFEYNNVLKADTKYIKQLEYKCGVHQCKCSTKLLKNITVINKIRIFKMQINFHEIPILNNTNLQYLEIYRCQLTRNHLLLLSHLNLKLIALHLCDDGTKYLTKINDMLEASKGSNVIDLAYFKNCEDQKVFDSFLYQWMEENTYETKAKDIASFSQISIKRNQQLR